MFVRKSFRPCLISLPFQSYWLFSCRKEHPYWQYKTLGSCKQTYHIWKITDTISAGDVWENTSDVSNTAPIIHAHWLYSIEKFTNQRFSISFYEPRQCANKGNPFKVKVNVFSRTFEYEWFPQIFWNCTDFNWRFGKRSFSVNSFISKVFFS